MKTTIKQKIGLIIFGIILALIILESGMRITGFTILSLQQSENKIIVKGDVYSILALGESTTAGRISWPKQLELILNNRSPDIKFKIFNEGIPGTNTAFILSRLEENLDKYNPDMVITMVGVNDYGLNLIYNDTLSTKITFLLEDLRVYKLGKWVLEVLKDKVKDIDFKATGFPIGNDKQITKKNDDVYFELGSNYISQGMIEKAEEMHKKAIEINPNYFKAYFELGLIYYKQNKIEKAEEMHKKAIEINPDYDAPYIMLGNIYYKQNKIKKEEEMYKKAIEINPNYVRAYSRLGRNYINQGMIEKAEDMIKKSIEIDPNHDFSYKQLRRIYNRQDISYKEIEKLFRENNYSFYINNTSGYEITQHNYKQLYNILEKRSIKYIAMQYPTLSVDVLKSMFNENENIIFVSNEENFKNALENARYEDYFSDSFARRGSDFLFKGNWGHTRLKGDILIAENVANDILEELGIE